MDFFLYFRILFDLFLTYFDLLVSSVVLAASRVAVAQSPYVLIQAVRNVIQHCWMSVTDLTILLVNVKRRQFFWASISCEMCCIWMMYYCFIVDLVVCCCCLHHFLFCAVVLWYVTLWRVDDSWIVIWSFKFRFSMRPFLRVAPRLSVCLSVPCLRFFKTEL